MSICVPGSYLLWLRTNQPWHNLKVFRIIKIKVISSPLLKGYSKKKKKQHYLIINFDSLCFSYSVGKTSPVDVPLVPKMLEAPAEPASLFCSYGLGFLCTTLIVYTSSLHCCFPPQAQTLTDMPFASMRLCLSVVGCKSHTCFNPEQSSDGKVYKHKPQFHKSPLCPAHAPHPELSSPLQARGWIY